MVRRAALAALAVGCLLTAINHGAALLRGEIDGGPRLPNHVDGDRAVCGLDHLECQALRDSRRVDDESTVTRT